MKNAVRRRTRFQNQLFKTLPSKAETSNFSTAKHEKHPGIHISSHCTSRNRNKNTTMINQLERRSALLVLLLPALIAAADHPRTIRHRRESEFLEGLGGPIALKPKNKTDSVEKLLSTESELLSTETLLLINKSTNQKELISTTPITTASPTTTASTTSTITAATAAEAAAKKVTETPPITKETKKACTTATATTTKPRPIPKSKSPPTTTTMATAKAPRLSTERKKSQSQTSSVNRSKEYTTPPCASSLILNGFYICNRANRPRCCNKSPTTNHEDNNHFLQSFKEDLMNDIKKQLEVFKKQIVSMIQYRKVAKS